MKECTNCKIIKNFNEFNLDTTSKSGYQSRCRTCNVIMNEFKAEDLIDRLYKIADTLKKQITKEY